MQNFETQKKEILYRECQKRGVLDGIQDLKERKKEMTRSLKQIYHNHEISNKMMKQMTTFSLCLWSILSCRLYSGKEQTAFEKCLRSIRPHKDGKTTNLFSKDESLKIEISTEKLEIGVFIKYCAFFSIDQGRKRLPQRRNLKSNTEIYIDNFPSPYVLAEHSRFYIPNRIITLLKYPANIKQCSVNKNVNRIDIEPELSDIKS